MRSKLCFAVAAPVLCLAIMFLVATSHGASAANNPTAIVVQISGRLDATSDPVTEPRCAGQLYQLSGTPENGTGLIYKGTVDGVGGFCAQVSLPLVEPDASGFDYHEEGTFVGTVQGCGTGTFRYTLDGVLYPLDGEKGYFPADEYWKIVDGSGTGDLVGIRSGLNHRTGGARKDGSEFAVYDPATNTLTCIPAQPQSRSGGASAKPARRLPRQRTLEPRDCSRTKHHPAQQRPRSRMRAHKHHPTRRPRLRQRRRCQI